MIPDLLRIKGHYVNRAVHALLNATGDSIGITESSCDELLSKTPVAILHVPADYARPLNVVRYLAAIRLAAPCRPIGAVAVWIHTEQAAERARLDAALAASPPSVRDGPNPPHGPGPRAHP